MCPSLAESAPEVASATSCTWSPFHGNFEGSCTAAEGKGRRIWTVNFFIWGWVDEIKYIDSSLPTGTALARVPGNDAPAPGTDGGIVKGEGRGTENALDGSEESIDWPDVPPATSLSVCPSCDDKLIFFFGELLKVFFFFFYSLFLRQACVAFSIKQVCNSATVCLLLMGVLKS